MTLSKANYTPRAINYAPKEHLKHWLYLESSLMIVIYNGKVLIEQATTGALHSLNFNHE